MFYKTLLVMIVIIFVALVLFGSRLNVPSWAIMGLLLLICPLSMAFMHGGHTHNGRMNDSEKDGTKEQHKN